MKSENSKVDKWIPICVVLILSMVCAVAMGSAFAADAPNTTNGDLGDSNTVLSTSTQISDVGNTSSTVNDNLSDNSNSQSGNVLATDNTNNAYSNEVLSSIGDDQSNNVYVDGSNTQDGNGTSDNPYNNINDAIKNAQSGSTIIISSGNYVLNGKTIIDKDLTLTAAPDATVTITNGQSGYFNINNGISLTLENLKFSNFYSDSNGGLIYNKGLLNIINCTFTNIQARLDGGVIYNDQTGVLNISGSTFSKNYAYNAGVIYNKGTLNINSSTFSNNGVTGSGGVIYNFNPGKISIIGSTFNDNYANQGGVITNWHNGQIVVKDSTFTKNGATTYGGAIYDNAKLNICGSEFISNYASRGGAIDYANTGSDSTIIDSVFSKNGATTYGGAIYSNSKLNISGSEFTGNYAHEGGAINYRNWQGITLTNTIFSNNGADTKGGAIYSRYKLDIYGSEFAGNYANEGGAVYCDDGIVKATNSNFTNNKAYTSGGAIYGTSQFNIDNSEFTNNNAYNGGAIYIDNKVTTNTITNSIFNSNDAAFGGAIYNSQKSKLTITDSTFTNNNENYYNGYQGGAIYNNGDLTILSSGFSNNYASNGGAAIYNTKSSILTIKDSSFQNNDNDAIFLDNLKNFNIANSNITTNGGNGIRVENCNKGEISYNNISNNQGNGIELYKSNNINIYGNTITSNNGYGVYIESSNNNKINQNSIQFK